MKPHFLLHLLIAGSVFGGGASGSAFHAEDYHKLAKGFIELSDSEYRNSPKLCEILFEEEFRHQEAIFMSLQRIAIHQGYDQDVRRASRIRLSSYIWGYNRDPLLPQIHRLAIEGEILWWSAWDQEWILEELNLSMKGSSSPERTKQMIEIASLDAMGLSAMLEDTSIRLAAGSRLNALKYYGKNKN